MTHPVTGGSSLFTPPTRKFTLRTEPKTPMHLVYTPCV